MLKLCAFCCTVHLSSRIASEIAKEIIYFAKMCSEIVIWYLSCPYMP